MLADSTGVPSSRTPAVLLQGPLAQLTPTMRQALAIVADDGACLTWTVPQAAQFIGVSTSYYYRAAHRGELPATRVGDRLLVFKANLLRFFEERAFLPVRDDDRGRPADGGPEVAA